MEKTCLKDFLSAACAREEEVGRKHLRDLANHSQRSQPGIIFPYSVFLKKKKNRVASA